MTYYCEMNDKNGLINLSVYELYTVEVMVRTQNKSVSRTDLAILSLLIKAHFLLGGGATVCSLALPCSSHSSTSLPGLFFTQTHSWAQHTGSHIMQPSNFPPYGLAAILDIEGQRARIVPSDCWVQVGYCALGGQIT